MISELSTAQKVGQLFFIGIDGPDLDTSAVSLFDSVAPGGVCLFSRNVRERQQTRNLTDQIREHLSAPVPFLSIDQEGGLVDRLRRILPPMPGADRLVNERHSARSGELIGKALRTLGLNMNFAPVVDVVNGERNSSSNGLRARTFGTTPEQVVKLTGAFLGSLEGQGIVGCLKHFPGLGASRVDSHEELPLVEIGGEELESTDLLPYRSLIASATVRPIMVAHAAFPAINLQERDQNGKIVPSSLSHNIVTGLLRQKLGFNGLVITDDLQMGAIIKNYGIGEACTRAIGAGVDMLAICSDGEVIREGYEAVTKAIADGTISTERLNESVMRILAVKSSLPELQPFNPTVLDTLAGDISLFDQELSSI
jgi:beta-N-acetylhexosaminidase